MISRSLDDLDRIAFRLSRTVRTQYPHLLSQGFTITDLEERLLPFREARRELADSSQDAFEATVLQLLSGERGYVRATPAMQQACLVALAFPAPTLSLIREWTATPLYLKHGSDQQAGSKSASGTQPRANTSGKQSFDIFPNATPQADFRPSQGADSDESASSPSWASPVSLASPASPASLTQCRYCCNHLPEGRPVTYCPHCGMDLTKRQCEGCSAELEAHWRFCISCGRGNHSRNTG